MCNREHDTEIMRKLAEKCTHLRVNRGLSQFALALEIGVEATWLVKFEHGKRGASIGTAARIAEAFGMTLSDLFEGIGAVRVQSNNGSFRRTLRSSASSS
jgi:transcriptional regulator with XRE-family HTH domain